MIAVFRDTIMSVGGIESWLYYLAKKYSKDHKIVVYYKHADQRQIHRLSKYVECIYYSGQKVVCDKAIYCYDFMGINNTEAKEYIHVVHADYKEINIQANIPKKVNKIYGVSKVACESFKEVTGLDCDILYNPIILDDTTPVIKLISATRLSEEKGWSRIKRLAEAMDNAGVKYQWDIYTNNFIEYNNPSVTFRKPRLDIPQFVRGADYLVQLSDTESYCYSIVESLTVGTPIIVTNFPVLKELGIKDVEHGIVIPLDETDYSKYVERIKPGAIVNYKPPESNWSKVLGKKEKVEYKYTGHLVECLLRSHFFTEERVSARQGDVIVIKDGKRVEELTKAGIVRIKE